MPQPGISYPDVPLVGGNSARETILQGYVFASGIHKPEHSDILSWKFPQYYVTTLLDRMGASEGVAQRVFTWNVMDRTREGSSIVAANGDGTATATIETDFDYDGVDNGYFLVGDVVRFANGSLGLVTAVGDANTLGSLGGSAGKQAIQVTKEGGGNWSVGTPGDDIDEADSFGHSHTSFGEASNAPEGRLYLPTEEYNYLTTLRRSFKISGSEFTNRTYLKDNASWYFTVEDIEMKEFAKDRENAIFFGTRYSVGNRDTTRGLLEYVLNDGVKNGYSTAAGVTETDLQEHIKDLMVVGSSNEMFVLCGANFLKQVQVALKDYAIAGAINYGSLGDNTAGLDFTQYLFMGKKINFAYYELFSDSKIVPYAGDGGTSLINFDDFSIWLDFGDDVNGRSLMTLKHKELGGNSRKFIHAYEVGMMNPSGANGGMVSNGQDAFRIHYLSEIGLEVRQAQRMGILRANAA
jgi:hypothetical protein